MAGEQQWALWNGVLLLCDLGSSLPYAGIPTFSLLYWIAGKVQMAFRP